MTPSYVKSAYRSLIERLVRPYVRHELPAWGLVYRRFVGSSDMDELWKSAGKRTLKDKIHGFELQLDIGTWSDRMSYFLGRYYDLPTQLLLRRALRRGDHTFDVGANVGHLSLLMVRLVGETGRVDAFEPNPIMIQRMRNSVEQNGIRNLFVHAYGLSTDDRELELFVPKKSPGETTFTPTPYDASEVDVIKASVKHGDAVAREVGAPVLMKIDVEGFECNVIDGFAATFAEHRPLVITEVMVEHLARAGESAATLFERMQKHGYRPLKLGIARSKRNAQRAKPAETGARAWPERIPWFGLSHELVLEPVTPDRIHYADVVWFDPANPDHAARLQLSA